MSKIKFTLEAEDFSIFESIDLNFSDRNKYDYVSKTTYDDDGKPVKIVTEYTYRDEEKKNASGVRIPEPRRTFHL